MNVTNAQWGVLIAIITGMFIFDFLLADRQKSEFTVARAAKWIAFYIGIAALFGVWVYWQWGSEFATQFVAGYVTEYSLSIDNLFVFLVILTSFNVPKETWHRALLLGIAIALFLRAVMIAAGTTLINRFVGSFLVFGAFLIWTAWHVAKEEEPAEQAEGRLIRWVRRVVPVTEDYAGHRLTIHLENVRHLTPLALVMVAIGTTDLLFALDSIPAILGLTHEGFLVLASNAFALMGLRQLFFLVQGLLDRLIFLARGLAVVLAFIGVKLMLHAVHELWWHSAPVISTGASLLVIGSVLLVTAVLSLGVDARRRRAGDGDEIIVETEQ
ncbi:MAG: TerC/Alx family metal homeostasis membrane protein [Candidatus Nanopelagicales bacterium]